MTAIDSALIRYEDEIEDKSNFVEQLVSNAQGDPDDPNRKPRDLTPQDMKLIADAKAQITTARDQMTLIKETHRLATESRKYLHEIDGEMASGRANRNGFEYRSAAHYLIDVIKSGHGIEDAAQRLDGFTRAAAHQTTGDNPGLIPEQLLGPVLNFVDNARPLVAALGPRQVPSGSWSRPRITQHTLVAKQTAEKTELASRKMTIEKLPVAADTYGGYVNISRQNIDWSQPAIMQIVIDDLATQYAIETEEAAAADVSTAATAGPVLPADATSADVAAALWAAAGTAYSAVYGQGRLIAAVSPDMLGVVGPLFAPINPTNAQSSGFSAGQFGSGVMGAVSGIVVVMSPALAAGTMIVLSTAAAEAYEDRVGALSVVEPSVLGTQVAYAGYFGLLVIEDGGIIEITQAS